MPPQGVYALYDDGGRVGPLPVIYSHYARGIHHWEVLVPAENVEAMRGMHIDTLPGQTMLQGSLAADMLEPGRFHVEGDDA